MGKLNREADNCMFGCCRQRVTGNLEWGCSSKPKDEGDSVRKGKKKKKERGRKGREWKGEGGRGRTGEGKGEERRVEEM